MGVFDSLAASKIDNIDFGFSPYDSVLFHDLGVNVNSKDGMGPRAFLVHACFCSFSIFLSLKEQIDGSMISLDGKSVDSLNINSLLRGLPYLKRGKVISKKVKDLFIVNFHV
jgi:hypothetical protein